MDILIAAVVVAAIVLGPTCVLFPKLLEAKRKGFHECSKVASRYVSEFEDTWVSGNAPAGRKLLGASDIQSLADMANSFQVVEQMRLFPFSRMVAVGVFVVFLLPIAPLLLTVIPIAELLKKLVGVFIA